MRPVPVGGGGDFARIFARTGPGSASVGAEGGGNPQPTLLPQPAAISPAKTCAAAADISAPKIHLELQVLGLVRVRMDQLRQSSGRDGIK